MAVVTGGGRGIGEASALALAEEDVFVVVTDLDETAAQATAAAIETAGGRAEALFCDVTSEDSCAGTMDLVVERHGHIDCAVNAAGVVAPTSGVEGSEWDVEVFDRILAVNLRGIMLSVKHEVRHMRARQWGAVVNVASGAALIGLPGAPAYTSSKHGVVGITRSAALELASSGVRVNAVCPGGVRTRMLAGVEDFQAAAQPNGRIAEPMEIGTAVRWLCSSESSFVLGAAIVVDGGVTAQ